MRRVLVVIAGRPEISRADVARALPDVPLSSIRKAIRRAERGRLVVDLSLGQPPAPQQLRITDAGRAILAATAEIEQESGGTASAVPPPVVPQQPQEYMP